jgi:hypothetical protein
LHGQPQGGSHAQHLRRTEARGGRVYWLMPIRSPEMRVERCPRIECQPLRWNR